METMTAQDGSTACELYQPLSSSSLIADTIAAIP
jgi:hypothetical protein